MTALASMDKGKWTETWGEILSGGNQRWKDGEQFGNYEREAAYLQEHGALPAPGAADAHKVHVFAPLAGDSPLPSHLFRKFGHSVSALDFVEAACDAMRSRFSGDGDDGVAFEASDSSDVPEGMKLWTAKGADGNEARVWCGDFFVELPSEVGRADVVFDKDSFGAIEREDRQRYLALVARYLKPNGYVLLEVKDKDEGKDAGPPFHFTKEDIETLWGAHGFRIVDHQPSLYKVSRTTFRQQGFLLQKKGE
eukprot:m.125920 g.125920  ORF g.125920 m.125920 type:complete len:251 (-) comp16664_c0_seq5:894-1646(-)